MDTLTVRNIAQKVIFENEYKGQLSDGAWENASPMGHYKRWCDCEVVVGEELGRNFYAVKDNYNLNAKWLLDIIADRMLTYVNLCIICPALINQRELPDSNSMYIGYVERAEANDQYSDYYMTKVFAWWDADMTSAVLDEASKHEHYTMKDLRKDITDLKKIMKVKK